MGYLDKDGLSRAFTKLKTLIDKKADVGHIHPYAGSSSAGGSANSAVKLDTSAGSTTQPVYFSGGKPVAIPYTIGKSVPSNAVFTDTTYGTGSSTTVGLTKLYTGTGSATDGTMTQSAITSALSGKANTHSHPYLPLTGGTMTGSIKFNDISIPRRHGQAFLVGIDAFDRGGTLTWSSASDVIVGTADKADSATTANRAIEVADYNNTGQGIKIGYAGNGFTSSDFQYALGMNDERKIKNVSQGEYRKWLGLGSAAYTSSGAYAASSHTHTTSQITNFPTSMPASDVYSWAKQSSKPSYSASEVGAVPISRTVNGKALSSNISLSAGDVGAAPSSHSHNYAGSSSAGGNANWANGSTYANYSYNDKPITTAGTGSAYTATVNGLTLVAGASFVMVPHAVSTTVAPTLNVNSLGAKNIRMRLSSNTSSTIQLIRSDFLVANKPVKVVYDGTYWVLDDFVQPDANYLYGTLISRGTSAPSNGTGGFIYIQTT